MSTRHHHSEDKLAEFACAGLREHRGARVLIGGLGLGFTLRSALQILGNDAQVTVAEIMKCVIQWNQNAKYPLGSDALADSRTIVLEGDVAQIIKENPKEFDSIILDIDNGAVAMSASDNQHLYSHDGIQAIKRALRPNGCLAIWSASEDPKFAKSMNKWGFDVQTEQVSAHTHGGGWHTLFIGRMRT